MSGKHGSIVEYIRAYKHYGGKPPIPRGSEHRRGSARSRPAYILAMVLSYATLGVGFGVSYWASTDLGVWAPIMLFAGGSAAIVVDMFVMKPVVDWYVDVPRYGLESIDVEHGVPSVATEVSD